MHESRGGGGREGFTRNYKQREECLNSQPPQSELRYRPDPRQAPTADTYLLPPARTPDTRRQPRPSHTRVQAGSVLELPPNSSSLVSRLPAKARCTQPLEPILFPKLRIYFADFPYLHCSIN